jgi:hypothetical protein
MAQPTGNPGQGSEALPMRNLQIEVRQAGSSLRSQSALGAQGGVVLQPGRSGANANITAQDSQRSDARDLVQRVLVLNGRNANINLGNSQPLRLVQARQAGTVFIDANSGFSARPSGTAATAWSWNWPRGRPAAQARRRWRPCPHRPPAPRCPCASGNGSRWPNRTMPAPAAAAASPTAGSPPGEMECGVEVRLSVR